MFFTNVFDEKERFVGLKVENIRYDPIQDENGRCVGFNPVIVNGQFDSHTFSYLGARNQYKEMGITSGLDEKYNGLVEVED